MRKIDYYVAISLDGYISGPNADISGFIAKGEGIKKYLDDLQNYDTVIMGRSTYEFGYQYGLIPGQLAYPHMKHYVFSRHLTFDEKDENLNICDLDISVIENLKKETGSNIYLCGGGQFASWLFENEKIDTLKIKLNPFIQGDGIKLFDISKKICHLKLVNQESFEEGLLILTYQVKY